jgi:uncharacterized membrane protein YbhN (UPF0104 family)
MSAVADTVRTRVARAVRAPAARPLAGAVLVIGVLAALATSHAPSAAATVGVLGDAHPGWLVVLLVFATAGPLLHGGLLRAGQATVGARFGRWEAIRLAAGIHAANLALRTAGAAGLAVLLVGHRDPSIGGAARSAAYVLGREVAHVCFAVVVAVALALVAIEGHVSGFVVAGGVLFLLSRVAHVAVLWIAACHPRHLPRWRRLDRLRAHAPAFAAALRGAAAHPRPLLRIAGWALVLDVVRIVWLWVALHAVGAPTSPDTAFESYGIVALLGTVSVLPAGLGAVDAGLVATLHHSGTTIAAAAAAVLLFRVAELWVPLLAGARPALAALRLRPTRVAAPAAS